MLGVVRGAVLVALAAWIVLSVINQFSPKWFRTVLRWDVFSVIPIWTFFAPNPGQSDYHLVCRDERADGSVGAWREVEISAGRGPWSFVWNPQKRASKALADIVSAFADWVPKDGPPGREIVLSMPYLMLLEVVSHLPREQGVTHRRFAVAESSGTGDRDDPVVLLLSERHALDGTPDCAGAAPRGALA